jgi:hypothetical protein
VKDQQRPRRRPNWSLVIAAAILVLAIVDLIERDWTSALLSVIAAVLFAISPRMRRQRDRDR